MESGWEIGRGTSLMHGSRFGIFPIIRHSYGLRAFYEFEASELAAFLNVDPRLGLSELEAIRRNREQGLNQFPRERPESAWTLLLRQLNNLIFWILAAAAIASFGLKDTAEGFAILFVIFINTLIGFVLDYRARQSMQALLKLDTSPATVLRDGGIRQIPSDRVCIGDILILEAGDMIVAEGNVLESNQLEADESVLTGESLPTPKSKLPSQSDSVLADQHNRLFKGTAVVNGNGRAIVTNIGTSTELGKISQMVSQSARSSTPLEARLDHLASVLVGVTAGLVTLYLLNGLLQERNLEQLIKTSAALAIAAIPEGMSVVATIALASGTLSMARKNVIIKRLSAVETLGSTSVIFTDKTGTLTWNRITVEEVHIPGGNKAFTPDQISEELKNAEQFKMLVRTGVLANNAQLEDKDKDKKQIGDPIDIALLDFAKYVGYDCRLSSNDCRRVAEKAFSSETRLMATMHHTGKQYIISVKGAAEEVVRICEWRTDSERQKELEISEAMARKGLRTLALACRASEGKSDIDFSTVKCRYLGLIGFLDPARKEVSAAIQTCFDVGVKIVMVTGDHPETALAIARQVGLASEQDQAVTGKDLLGIDLGSQNGNAEITECRVFARVSPGQKLDLIDFYQKQGHIVGMTGDGVNDAPALKKADIGIAMGLHGTQVAAEAADMVLKDDSFASIVSGIEQGRVIFDNIRKFVIYLLSCNMSEILVVTFAGFFNMGSPLLPLQVLFINIITDIFPALALALGKQSGAIMKQPRRNARQQLLDKAEWVKIVWYAIVMAASVLGVYWYASVKIGVSEQAGNTLTFYALSLTQLLHVFNLHLNRNGFLNNEVTRNKYVWMALCLCLTILVTINNVFFLRSSLTLERLTNELIWLIAAAGLFPLLITRLRSLLTGPAHNYN